MGRSTKRLVFAACLFGMLGVAGTVRAQAVPMKGTLAGVATIEVGLTQPGPNAGDVAIPVESTATGEVSHLGRSTLTETHTTVIFASTGYQTSQVLGGQATLTAANGDELFLTFSGTGVRTSGGGFDDTFSYKVIGGTGRFAGAKGSGQILSSDQAVSAPFVDGRGHVVQTAPFVFDLSGVLIKGSK